MLKFLGNIIWFVFGGLVSSIVWVIIGCLWSITIIGIPLGLQCFKMARLYLWPFGKRVEYSNNTSSVIINILWLLLGGIPIAATLVMSGIVLCLTIIGIPFGIQQFKLAVVALMPFGSKIIRSNEKYVAIAR